MDLPRARASLIASDDAAPATGSAGGSDRAGRRRASIGRGLVVVLTGTAVVVGCRATGSPLRAADRPSGGASSSATATVDLAEYAAGLGAATASARQAADLAPLEPSACAEQAAADRARALVGRPLEHASLAGVLRACAPASTAAENLSRAPAGADGPADVVDAWLGSPGHRANLLDPDLTAVAVACVLDATGAGDTRVLCSQVFLGP